MKSINLLRAFLSFWLCFIYNSTMQAACVYYPIKFKVSETSFSEEPFLLKQNENGATVGFLSRDIYFNHAKAKWCINKTNETKDKELCLSKEMAFYITDPKDKKVARVQLDREGRDILIQSVTKSETADLTKPYLRVSDQSEIINQDCSTCDRGLNSRISVEQVEKSQIQGRAVADGPSGHLRKDGSVSFSKSRFATYDISASTEAIELKGYEIEKNWGCGGVDKKPFTRSDPKPSISSKSVGVK